MKEITICVAALVVQLVVVAGAPEQNSVRQSAQASERLMRELKNINKASGNFTVELVGGNLYEWLVRLTIDAPKTTTDLHRDLEHLRSMGKDSRVSLRVSFTGDYPRAPPFVRVAAPLLEAQGWSLVSDGGSLCLQILSSSGWRADLTMESVISSIAYAIGESNTRVNWYDLEKVGQHYTAENARKRFEEIVRGHEWDKFAR